MTGPALVPPLSLLVDRWDPADLPRVPARWVVGSGARSFAIAGLTRHVSGPILVITPGERDAEELVDDLDLFVDSAVVLPAWETLPFELVSPNAQTMALRARARHLLGVAAPGTVVVGSVRAMIQRVSPSSVEPISIIPGMEYDVTELARRLAGLGYHRADRVEGRGEFAVRGGILDVFPAQADNPVRIDFWGDEVEELRSFSPSSQRSEEPVSQLEVYPSREFRPAGPIAERAAELVASEPWAAGTFERLANGQMFPGMESWLPWLTEQRSVLDGAAGATVVLIDPNRAKDRGRDLIKEEQDLAEALAPTWGELAPAAGAHPSLFGELDPDPALLLEMPALAAGPDDPILEVRGFDATAGDPDSVAAGLTRLISRGMAVVVAMDGLPAAQRVSRVLAESGLALSVDDPGQSTATVLATGIHHGFVAPRQGVAVLGEQEIAGRRRSHRRTGRVHPRLRQEYRDLTEGDFVVHHQHGIGRFEGLVSQTMAGVEREYLIIGYHGGDRLYVPTDQLSAVAKYTGGETPRVSRMGGKDWSEQRARVRKAVAAVAQHVVEMHRKRAMATGHSYPPDSPWQREMEGAFPFEETPDQLVAIGDVKADMEADKAMDRLVFGDVGFGKTEVAIRAAFKAVQAGKQVAVLCPTTLLAQQHHQTFSDRLAPYPVRVEALSRFLTPRQQKQVVAGLATGEIDVVVGTHRLLSEDVNFKDLGLIVVDEEQRFGVNAKDALKRLRVGVDVVTLTATPIPRTLEMALTGIRDVSHIRTPPEDRHPILTYVGAFDEQAVSAAIRRELLRDGQVFYVHNRVQSIERAVARLQSLVPDARYAVAHGQMSESQLEQVMIDFWSGGYDILVATTIIESGLDLPHVNTLIVERADLLGLAQLYQLRGRVGRSSQRAYAYLFHPADRSLSEEAHRRLEAIGEATDLGSGFQLALKDLEIRGAGSILGEVQSGHIAAVGFDLYAELVAEAVSELEGRDPPGDRVPDVRIDLPIDAQLPDEYIADQAVRLEAYRRLAGAATSEAVGDVVSEWTDRFGPLPAAAAALVDVARIRAEAIRVGLTEVVKLRNEVRLSPVDLSISQEVRLERLSPRAVLRATEATLFLPAPAPLVDGILAFLDSMWPVETTPDPSPAGHAAKSS